MLCWRFQALYKIGAAIYHLGCRLCVANLANQVTLLSLKTLSTSPLIGCVLERRHGYLQTTSVVLSDMKS